MRRVSGPTFHDVISLPTIGVRSATFPEGPLNLRRGFTLPKAIIPNSSPYMGRIRRLTNFEIPVVVIYSIKVAEESIPPFNVDLYNHSLQVYSAPLELSPRTGQTSTGFSGIISSDLVNSIPVGNPSSLEITGHGVLPVTLLSTIFVEVFFNAVLSAAGVPESANGSLSYVEEDNGGDMRYHGR